MNNQIIKDSKILQNFNLEEDIPDDFIDAINNKQLQRFYQNDHLFTKDEIIELLNVMSYIDNKNLENVFKIADKLDYKLNNDLNDDLIFEFEKIKFDNILLNKKLLFTYNNGEFINKFNYDDQQMIEKEIMHQINLIFLTNNNELLFELDHYIKDFISMLDNSQIYPYIISILKNDNSDALHYLFNTEIIYIDKNGDGFFDKMLKDAKKYDSIECIEIIKKWI